ncbi:MAG: hydrogenase maturation nickel metallochaperone HypA [Syntrophorhabdaceae bacterium]|nr:hydrogenase maturation nickel metallochaperone HypA [Syntrophorhabdaceae bacterium]
MHELSLATEILNVALAEAARHQAKKITTIYLRVGVIRAIEPEHLSFMFDHLSSGTLAEGAKLSLEEMPVRLECASCGVIESAAFAWECPKCKGCEISVKGGDALDIVSIDIEV